MTVSVLVDFVCILFVSLPISAQVVPPPHALDYEPVPAPILQPIAQPIRHPPPEPDVVKTAPKSEPREIRNFQFVPKAVTIIPIFMGVGADLIVYERLQVGASIGFTPTMYSSTIGTVAANLGGHSSYKDVVEAAFQNNFMWRVNAQFNFKSSTQGWRLGVAFSYLTSSGQADITTVLSSATRNNYSQLTNLLATAGRSTEVSMNSSVLIGEIYTGYSLEVIENLSLTATLGIGKVLNSDILLKTGLPDFESSELGHTLMRNTELELQRIVIEYGLSPTLGLQASYAF